MTRHCVGIFLVLQEIIEIVSRDFSSMPAEPDALRFAGANEVLWGRRRLLYFSGCDYFRLARDPRVARAVTTTLQEHGLSVAASRRTTGNHPLYARLEAALARFFDAESALVLPDSYFAPMAAAQALAGEYTHGFMDELAHGALQDAARMGDGRITLFKHRNAADLARRLARCGSGMRPMIFTDGLFGHDGSVAPLREYLKILPRNGCLLVDDAHGVGVLGATGKGALEFEAVDRRRVVQCATLSKAFGTYGGVVLGTLELREKLLTRCRLFAGTTPLPLPLAGAALAALKILQREPARRRRLQANTAYLRSQLRAGGWDLPETPGPIVRLPAMAEAEAGELKADFLAAGIYPPFIKYGKALAGGFFRLVVSSEHTREHLDRAARVLVEFKMSGIARPAPRV